MVDSPLRRAHACAGVLDEPFEVYRTQVARVVRRQVRLGARVRGLYRELRRRVVVVYSVYKHHARLTVQPRALHDLLEEIPGVYHAVDLAVARVPEREFRVRLHGLHKLVGDCDRDVEVVYLVVIPLAAYELLDVWVIHAEDSHVRPAPGSALLDLVRRSVVNSHERYRPTGHTHRGFHDVVLRP